MVFRRGLDKPDARFEVVRLACLPASVIAFRLEKCSGRSPRTFKMFAVNVIADTL